MDGDFVNCICIGIRVHLIVLLIVHICAFATMWWEAAVGLLPVGTSIMIVSHRHPLLPQGD